MIEISDMSKSWEISEEILKAKSENVLSFKHRCISFLVLWCKLTIVHDVDAMINLVGELHFM